MEEGSGSLLDLGQFGFGAEPPPGSGSGTGGASAPPGASAAGAGDDEDDLSPEGEDGPAVPKRGRSKAKPISRADCARALNASDGDFGVAARVLGLTENALRLRVSKNPQLAALFHRDVAAPTTVSVMTRDSLPVVPEGSALADQILAQNRSLLRNGLAKAGIKPETIEKLQLFDGFATDAGNFLITSLDLTHRMTVYLSVALLEEAQRIKTDYLDDATLDDEMKIQWQSAYTDIVEQIGKTFDRTLVGTQAMAKLLGTDEGDGKKKKKPGFRPLAQRAG